MALYIKTRTLKTHFGARPPTLHNLQNAPTPLGSRAGKDGHRFSNTS